MSEVVIRENESFEAALKRFKKKVQQDGILQELKKREYYEKPSERRKRKMMAAIRRQAKRVRAAAS